ncbi:MAG TPA: GGDEF domain-containing protein [Desulfosporosinus sp.]|nr:GGDEF domain-containing protein [Desulfosporosinus sp.]
METKGLKVEDITELIQTVNEQTNSLEALKTFVRGCVTLFGCQMAAIWVVRSEKYYLLAKSTNVLPNEKYSNNFAEAACKHVLSFPLRHLGEELGILELFSYDELSHDSSTMTWLNQLGPLVASLVSGHEMRAVALEREKDLNLLLWGTEILVQIQTESELLEEAGEMAMVLNLEAGFFFMRHENNWKVQAPFGRLKQKDNGWEQWVFDQIQINPDNYTGHEQTESYVLSPSRPGLKSDFQWQKLLIQPVETNSGIIGELWVLDFQDNKLKSRKEVFAAFARSLGVALETIRQRRRLEQMATTDSLTGILNRQGFSQRLRAEMASTKRRGSSFLLLLLDLDGFKILNDTLGHPTGDRALCVIANNIQSFIRENDILARSGGDELSLVLVDMQKGPEAVNVISRLKARMGLEEFKLGISIGVAEFPMEADNYESLYHLADERLYIGKNSGKNKTIFD